MPDHSAFGVSPRPNTSEYTVAYDYYTTHTDLSAHGDNMSLPDRFGTLIVDRAKYYTYMLRSDPQHAQLLSQPPTMDMVQTTGYDGDPRTFKSDLVSL